METIRDLLVNVRIRDIIDILIVTVALYKIFLLIKETRAEQLIKGIVILLIITQLSKALKLYTVYWILSKIMSFGIIAILIVFQAELRKVLEYVGATELFRSRLGDGDEKEYKRIVEDIIDTTRSLSRDKVGALIIIERNTGLSEIIKTGVEVNGRISSNLLVSIFAPITPLHDGAVVLQNQSLKAAGCFLPLSKNQSLDKKLGTRHRAALGVSEVSDSLAIIVSEETGMISVAERGTLKLSVELVELRNRINTAYGIENGSKPKAKLFSRWWK